MTLTSWCSGERVGQQAGVVADARGEAPAGADDAQAVARPGGRGAAAVARPSCRLADQDQVLGSPARRGRPGLRPGGAPAPLGQDRTRRTRIPSGIARRLLTPCRRGHSVLPTSVIRTPARATRTLMSVSISKPSPHASSRAGHRAARAGGRSSIGSRSAPEGVVAVAQVGIGGAEQQVDQPAQRRVADRAEAGDVLAAAAPVEPGALGEISPVRQSRHEGRDLARVSRPVGVQRDHDVTAELSKTAGQCVAFAEAGLLDDLYVRPGQQRGTGWSRRWNGRPR